MWRADRDRSRHRRDLDGNKCGYCISAQSTLARLPTPGEQQAMSHPVPARHAADRLANLQGLFDQANLLVITPSSPTLGAQYIDLHSSRDLKARLKVKSSGRLSNYTRRPPPEGYEAARGRLRIERIANKDFVTLAEIKRMRELCRVPASEPGMERVPTNLSQSLASEPVVSPQDALRARLKQSRVQEQSKS